MLVNFDVIVIFSIYGKFGAIRKPDARGIVCKNYTFISSNLKSPLPRLGLINTTLTLWEKR